MKRVFLLLLLFSKIFGQITTYPTSTIACNTTSTSANFTLTSGTAPFSFTIQTPSCATTYTASSTTTNTFFPISCPGIYTFAVKDALNASLGSVTHTTTLSNTIGINVFAFKDTICEGSSLTLSIMASAANFTISPINWSSGGTGSFELVTPTVTTTYSVTGLYTTSWSRTCTAMGSRVVVTEDCSIGINEYQNMIGKVKTYPNPASNILNIAFDNDDFLNSEIEVLNYLGEIIFKQSYSESINVSSLSSGYYILRIKTHQGFLCKKFIKE